MSPRHIVHFGPRTTRFLVLALALLQLVAPTWHICALGGHVAAHSASASHHGAAKIKSEPNRPLICFCAPHQNQKPLDPKTPRLDGISASDHATCLALLLQTMPGQTAAPLAVFESRALVTCSFNRKAHHAPTLCAPRRFRGRAPPWKS